MECVAPSLRAFSSFLSAKSTATMVLAPDAFAIWIQLRWVADVRAHRKSDSIDRDPWLLARVKQVNSCVTCPCLLQASSVVRPSATGCERFARSPTADTPRANHGHRHASFNVPRVAHSPVGREERAPDDG